MPGKLYGNTDAMRHTEILHYRLSVKKLGQIWIPFKLKKKFPRMA